MNPDYILNLPMEPNGARAATIKAYLKTLLYALWEEGEGFSGKRPFGDSGWEKDLIIPLVKGGAISGEVDPDYGDVIDYDRVEADKAIRIAIANL